MADLTTSQIEALWRDACQPERNTAMLVESFARSIIAADRALNAERAGWVPMHERAPEPDTHCAVMLRYSLDRPPFIATDRWEMQREDPTGMGGPTMEMGYGWNDNYEGDVIAWLALPPMPPADWDQRLPAAPTPDQTKG